MKRKTFSVFFVAAGLAAAGLFSSGAQISETASKPVIELEYRALQPGEVILASLKNGPEIRRAAIRFQNRSYVLTEPAAGTNRFAFIGLDLDIKPGTYPMMVTVERAGGAVEDLRKDIVILAKTFPEKKLWVKEGFVTPPRALEERIRRESELVAWIYSRVTPRWLGQGRFALPHEGKIDDNFGQRRIYNNRPRSPHAGVDIEAPLGESIQAANAGEVVLASDLYFSGKTVIIDHGLGVFSSYGHLSKILVRREVSVRKGDIIGRSGSTGRSTGPHLHWAIRIVEARVDPSSLLGLPVE